MSIEFLRLPSYLFAILLIACMVCLIFIFVIHFLVPRNLLRKYFKEPYFSPAETEFFSGFPFGYIRTVMFMRLVGFPKSGKKRGLTEAYRLAPPWFRLTSKVVLVLFLAMAVPMFILGIFLYFAFCVFHDHC